MTICPLISKNIVQNVKLIRLWGNNLVPLHFVWAANRVKSTFQQNKRLYLYNILQLKNER